MHKIPASLFAAFSVIFFCGFFFIAGSSYADSYLKPLNVGVWDGGSRDDTGNGKADYCELVAVNSDGFSIVLAWLKQGFLFAIKDRDLQGRIQRGGSYPTEVTVDTGYSGSGNMRGLNDQTIFLLGGTNQNFISAIQKGNALKVLVQGIGQWEMPLNNTYKAVEALRSCYRVEVEGKPPLVQQAKKPAPKAAAPKPAAPKPVAPKPAAPKAPVAPPAKIALIPGKSVFAPGEDISVAFSGLPAQGQDWIALSAKGHKQDEYYDMTMLEGRPSAGNLSFGGLPAGDYEIRVYTNWPEGGYRIAARSPIEVAAAPTAPAPSATVPPPPPSEDPTEPEGLDKPAAVPAPPPAPAPAAVPAPKPAPAPQEAKAPPAPAPSPQPSPEPVKRKSNTRPTDTPRVVIAESIGERGLALVGESGQTLFGPVKFIRNRKPMDGYFVAYVDGHDQFVHRSGKIVPNDDTALYWGEGFGVVKQRRSGTSYYYIDEAGNRQFDKYFSNAKAFHEGLAEAKGPVAPKSAVIRWGYMDHGANFVIPPQFEKTRPFKDGVAAVMNKKDRWAMIDRGGNLLTGYDYVGIENSWHGLVRAHRYDGPSKIDDWHLLSLNGANVLGQAYKTISPFYNIGWKLIDDQGRESLVDLKGQTIFPFGSKLLATSAGDGLITVRQGKKGLYGYTDLNGKIVIEPIYLTAREFSEGRAFVIPTQPKKVHLIDKTGSVVKAMPDNVIAFQQVGKMKDGRAPVLDYRRTGQVGYIDSTGELVISFQFDGTPGRMNFKDGLAPVCLPDRKPRKCGIIDTKGNWVIGPNENVRYGHFQ